MESPSPRGLRLIVAYKGTKAALQLAAAVILVVGASRGLGGALADWVNRLRAHAVHTFSDAVVASLLRFLGKPRDLRLVAAALAGDALVSAAEAWVLMRGYTFGPWLVVGATGSLIPFEIAALAHRFHPSRLVLLAINLSIVVYLVRRARQRPVHRVGEVTTN